MAQGTTVTGKDDILAELEKALLEKVSVPAGVDKETVQSNLSVVFADNREALGNAIRHDSATTKEIKDIASGMIGKLQADMDQAVFKPESIENAVEHAKGGLSKIYDAVRFDGVDAIVKRLAQGLPEPDAKALSAIKGDVEKMLKAAKVTSMEQGHIESLQKSLVGAGLKGQPPLEAVAASFESLKDDIAKGAAEAAKATESAGFFASKFAKPSLGAAKENWAASSTGIKFARGVGTGLGAVMVTRGVGKIFSKDEETGESHPVGGLIQAGAGATVIAASLLAKSKGGAALSS